MVCRYIICIRFSCFNSYVRIRQRNSIHSTSCTLLFISLFPKSTDLCFASFKLSKSCNDEYIYWRHREINCYFCTSLKARISNDGSCSRYRCKYCNSNISSLRYCFKKITFTIYAKDYIFGGLAIGIAGAFGFYIHKYIIFSHSLGIQTLWEITLTTIVYIVLLFTFKLIRKEELSRLPIIRKLSFLK